MSTSTKKQPEPIIPTEEVKKENTKVEKGNHGRTNKGSNATAPKDDRKNKTGQNRRDPNAKRTEGTYIKKAAQDNGEAPVSDEEKKEGGEKKQHKPRYEKKESIYNWDKKAITLETPIPIKPTAKEIVAEPKREDLNKHVDAIDAKIEAAKNKRYQRIVEISNRDKTNKTELSDKSAPLHTQLKELFEIQKVKKTEHDAAKAELTKKQESCETIFKRCQDIRNKMKKLMSADKLQDRLEELVYQQRNEKLSNQQEKRIVQEIDELKQSLPHAIPLKKLEDEHDAAKKEERALKGKQGAAYKALKEVKEKIDDIKKRLDEIKAFKEETTTPGGNPEIELIKKETADLIEELKKQKHETFKKFDADRKAYEEQQELLRYIDYVKKQHEFLKKREVYKKRDEERKKREEEEKVAEEEKKKSKYLVYVEIADSLIDYLQKLSGKGDKKDYVDSEQTHVEQKANIKPEDLTKILQKEKLTVLVSKKDRPDQSQNIFGGHNKQKVQKPKETTQKQEKPQEKNVIEALQHTYDIMEFFEKLAVSAPTFKTEIEKTITLIQEKKQYYIDLPNQENGDATEEKPAEEKHDKKGKKQNKIEFDETSFPTIEN